MNKKVILIIVLVLAIVLAYSYMSNKHNNKTLKPSAENLINETIKYNIKEIDADYVELSDIPHELLSERKFGLYVINDLTDDKCQESNIRIIIKLCFENKKRKWKY